MSAGVRKRMKAGERLLAFRVGRRNRDEVEGGDKGRGIGKGGWESRDGAGCNDRWCLYGSVKSSGGISKLNYLRIR